MWLVAAAFNLTPAGMSPVALAADNGDSQVAINQQPLTIRPSIPPNIVLMLDDSGSMRFDIMPDYNADYYKNRESFIDSAINGLYYNPNVTYIPPPEADGSSFPAAKFSAAWTSGFAQKETVNLSTYRGEYDVSDGQYEGSAVQYSISVPKQGAASYTPASTCPEPFRKSNKDPGYCYDTTRPDGRYDFYNISNHDFYVSRCTRRSDVYNDKTGKCTPGISFFTYITTSASGQSTRHYVAGETGDCGVAGLSAAVCEDSAAARQNVANWFSYYHTRMLMAKTGLFKVFSEINDKYRIGFGSINNSSNDYIKTLDNTWKQGVRIADVAKFGNGNNSDDQRSHFWHWLETLYPPEKGTPLRKALQAVGEYYETSQPWTKDDQTLACRQSYAILTTDGFWNRGNPDGVGKASDEPGEKITGPDDQEYQYIPALPYKGGSVSGDDESSLADVAMKYWKIDLMPDLSNEVPTNEADPAFWQHMVTFTIGMGFKPVGIKGTAPDGTSPPTIDQIFKWAIQGDKYKIGNFSWPTPSSGSKYNIADMAHAAVNGHGGFYSAIDPQSFTSGLRNTLKRTSSRTGSGTSPAANSSELKIGTTIYQTLYHTASWTGELKAFAIDPQSGKPGQPVWNAAERMPEAKDRNIWTYNPQASDNGYVEFNTDSITNLSSAEQKVLGDTTTAREQMVKYLRGDNDANSNWRQRKNSLGDIVGSQPVYVGPVDANDMTALSLAGSGSYNTFIANHQNRAGRLYVAANDGMLHGFATSDQTTNGHSYSAGEETYAYLPAAVITDGSTRDSSEFPGITQLADPNYGTSNMPHQFFNDGQLTVANAYFSNAWHTVLVGTTGRGAARAIYALDVTNPDDIKFLWERAAGDGKTGSDYIGQMVGKPIIAQVDNGSGGGEWVVLIGNGYNSKTGTAALLQFRLSNGQMAVYTTNGVKGNGLSTPAVWIGKPAQNLSTQAFAGDLQGNIWAFDLGGSGGSGNNLFTARADNGASQPITSGLLLGKDPLTGDKWLFFGTGRYLSSDDVTDTSLQSWYGLIVQRNGSDTLLTSTRDDLVKRSILQQLQSSTADDGTIIPPMRIFTLPESVTPIGDKHGWYIDLAYNGNELGERMVSTNQFEGNTLIGTSIVPKATDLCNPSGTGWVMALDPFTGTNPASAFFLTNGKGTVTITVNGQEVSVPIGGIGTNSQPNAPTFIGDNMLIGLDNGKIKHEKVHGNGGRLGRVS